MQLWEGRLRHVRPSLQQASEGDPPGRLLDRLHDRGRGSQAVEPRHALLRSILSSTLKQVGAINRRKKML